jgi:hypothetical protein
VSLGGVLQAEYKYDYLGRQFSRKLVPSNTVIHSVFRSDGKRISEYNEGTGALIRHYVWMGDTPVAVIEGGQFTTSAPTISGGRSFRRPPPGRWSGRRAGCRSAGCGARPARP